MSRGTGHNVEFKCKFCDSGKEPMKSVMDMFDKPGNREGFRLAIYPKDYKNGDMRLSLVLFCNKCGGWSDHLDKPKYRLEELFEEAVKDGTVHVQDIPKFTSKELELSEQQFKNKYDITD